MAFSTIIGAGLSSSVYTWILNRTGIIQDIAHTTYPFLGGAFLFGAVSGSVDYVATELKDRVQRDVFNGNETAEKGLDVAQFALAIASRYAVAKICNEFFGTKITTKFVHLWNGLDVLEKASDLGTISLMVEGFYIGITAKVISLFIATPVFKNAFYFGMINGALFSTISRPSPLIHKGIKEQLGIKDLRALYLSHLIRRLSLVALSCYASTLACSKVFNIEIPKSYALAVPILSTPIILVGSVLNHIGIDLLLEADFEEVDRRIEASGVEEVQATYQSVKDLFQNMDEINWDTAGRRYAEGDFREPLSNVWRNFQGSALFGAAFQAWKRGRSAEDIYVDAAESIAGNEAITGPLIEALSKLTGAELNKAGADFILDEVLKGANEHTIEAFRDVDPDSDIIQFVATKAVAIYAVGSKEEEEIPLFFSADTRDKIATLREELNTKELKAPYETILQRFGEMTTTEPNEEEADLFFRFEDEYADGSPERVALTRLMGIGSPEMQNSFSRVCYGKAVQRLAQ